MRLAINQVANQHGAGATIAFPATDLGTGKMLPVTDKIQDHHPGGKIRFDRCFVEDEFYQGRLQLVFKVNANASMTSARTCHEEKIRYLEDYNGITMKEVKDIIAAYDFAVESGQQVAMATVVHTEGSSYRGPGARMLITEEGRITGAISGGCLEGDALRKALYVMGERKSMLVTYDSNDEDDAQLGLGLGCTGIIQVLIEPIDKTDPHNPAELLREFIKERQPAVLITIFSLQDKKNQQPGTRLLVKSSGSIPIAAFWKDLVLEDARKTLALNKSDFITYDKSVTGIHELTAFFEFIQPPISLVVIGAGNDVKPLVHMASILGWETTVVDGRSNYASAERFPSSCQVLVSKPGDVLSQVTIDNRTVFALMTHNYNYDLMLLKELLSMDIPYIGLLGPKRRRDRLLGELREQGVKISDKQLSLLHGPIGLDIGAETAEEIALSVLAEIKAVLTGKTGSMLKNGEDTIHTRVNRTLTHTAP